MIKTNQPIAALLISVPSPLRNSYQVWLRILC